MTLLLREVAGFVIGSTVWIALEFGIAAFAGIVWSRWTKTPRLIAIAAAFGGALIVASLAVRFTAPMVWEIHIGRRPLPIGWSSAGAAVGPLLIAKLRQTEPVTQ